MDRKVTPDAPVERRIHTSLGELAVLEWGAADAPPLLALHGWLDNAASFAHLAPLLATRYRVLALDLPGHGHSAHLPPGCPRYHIVDQVDVVLDAADALGLTRFDLLGHSLGAGVASLLAAAAPERIDHLLLIEGLGPLAGDGSDAVEHLRRSQARRGSASRLRVFANVELAVKARVAAGGLTAAEARPIVLRNLRAVEGGFAWASDRRLRSLTPVPMDEGQVQRLLHGIEVPACLLLARPLSPYWHGAIGARIGCVAGIQVTHLDGPHHLHIHTPQVVAKCLLDFRASA